MTEFFENQMSQHSDLENAAMECYEDNVLNNQSDSDESMKGGPNSLLLEEDLDISSSMDEDKNSSADSDSDAYSEADSEETNNSAPMPYMLFKYREELCRLKNNENLHAKIKLRLTQELLSYSMERISEYDTDELRNIEQQINFTHQLQLKLDHMETLENCRELEASLNGINRLIELIN